MRTHFTLIALISSMHLFAQGNFNPADADLSFPRSIIDKDQVEAVRQSLSNAFNLALYEDIYQFANLDIPPDNSSENDRRRRSEIAREAAFVVLINRSAGSESPLPVLPESEKLSLIEKTIQLLNEINTEVEVQSGWSFYHSWQFRSKELIHYLIAYDLLKGADVPDVELSAAKEKLQTFSSNLYVRSIDGYPNPIPGLPDIDFYFYNTNNHGVMTSAALGLAAIVLGDCTSDDPHRQPENWLKAGLWNLDNLLWRVDGLLPRVSEAGVIAGYAEGPSYFNYGFVNAFPFIRAMWNYLPDQVFDIEFEGLSRSIKHPWYDTNFHNLYKWMMLIRMPDGRSPAIHDSPAHFSTVLPALSGITEFNIPSVSDQYNIWTRAQLLSTLISPGEYTEPLFQALPDAGSLVFRSSYDDPQSIYLHLIGKNGIALYGAKAHHQADAMSFELYYNQHVFAIDEGYTGSNYRTYVNKATDHNLILVNGKGPKPPISEWVSEDNEVFIENYFDTESLDYGELSGAWEGANLNRKTLFVDDTYFVMWDFVESSNTNTYQFQMHCSGLSENQASNENGQVQLNSQNHSVLLSKSEDQLLVRTELNQTEASYDLKLDSTYNGIIADYHHKFLVTSPPLSKAQFTSILFPYSIDEPQIQKLPVDSGQTLLKVIRNQNTDLIFTHNDTELIDIASNSPFESFKTNAQAGILSFDENQEPDFLFFERGDSFFIENKGWLVTDEATNLAIDFLNAGAVKGFINSGGTLRIPSDSSLIVQSGSITEIYYDEGKKESLIHFSEASNFHLIPGPAEILNDTEARGILRNYKLFPNPNRGSMVLQLESEIAHEYALKIIDAIGKTVYEQKLDLFPGINQIPIKLGNFQTGIYNMILTNNQGSKAISFSIF